MKRQALALHAKVISSGFSNINVGFVCIKQMINNEKLKKSKEGKQISIIEGVSNFYFWLPFDQNDIQFLCNVFMQSLRFCARISFFFLMLGKVSENTVALRNWSAWRHKSSELRFFFFHNKIVVFLLDFKWYYGENLNHWNQQHYNPSRAHVTTCEYYHRRVALSRYTSNAVVYHVFWQRDLTLNEW